LVKDFGASVNQIDEDGDTPLLCAESNKQHKVAVWLLANGATPTDPKVVAEALAAAEKEALSIAVTTPKPVAPPTSQTLESAMARIKARAHCAALGCRGDALMTCQGCKKARYCGQTCFKVHWKVHKVDCKKQNALLTAAQRG
jgi:hypothetical protein